MTIMSGLKNCLFGNLINEWTFREKIAANCAILNVDKGFCCSTYYVVPIIFVSARGKFASGRGEVLGCFLVGGENHSGYILHPRVGMNLLVFNHRGSLDVKWLQ